MTPKTGDTTTDEPLALEQQKKDLYQRKKEALEARRRLMEGLGVEDAVERIDEKLADLEKEGINSDEITEHPADLGEIKEEIESLRARAETFESVDEQRAETLRAQADALESGERKQKLELLAKVRDVGERQAELKQELEEWT